VNNKIEPHYVDFNTAKWLKEKGFDIWVSKHYYFEEPKELRCSNGFKMPRCSPQTPVFNYMKLDGVCYAPEQHQVIEFLRINHSIWVAVDVINNLFKYKILQCNGIVSQTFGNELRCSSFDYNSPQEAYSEAFDYIRKNNLI